MLGALSRFNIPSATQSSSSRIPGSQVEVVPIQRDDPIKIDPSQIPDYVYNEDGSGYAAMFSPMKIGLTSRKNGSLFLPRLH